MIGVTGGISSGKSAVAERLCKETGFAAVSADKLAAEMLGRPGRSLELLAKLIGNHYFLQDGRLDRGLFRQALFADVSFRLAVDKLLHPMILAVLRQKVDELEIETGKSIIVEIPLLYEAGWQKEFSEIVVVYAPPSVCLARLRARDDLSMAEAENTLAAQKPIEEKVLLADYVIDNSGAWFDTLLQIKRLAELFLAKRA